MKKFYTQFCGRKTTEAESDFATLYSGGVYSTPTTFPTPRTHAGRVVLTEYRGMQLEKRFFCDRPADKTAILAINRTTNHGALPAGISYELSLQSNTISCQYPITEVTDLSPNQTENVNNNAWNVLIPYPTKDEVVKHTFSMNT